MKSCSKCLEIKPLVFFYKAKKAKQGRQSWCINCMKELRKLNSDEYRARAAEAYKNTREVVAAYGRNRRLVNSEIIKARKSAAYKLEKQRIIDKTAAWRKDNPDKYRVQVRKQMARRRARLILALPSWADTKKIGEFYQTADALNMWTGEWHHVDHIVPLNSKLVCGLHCAANLQVLLGVDNMAKSNRYWPDMP